MVLVAPRRGLADLQSPDTRTRVRLETLHTVHGGHVLEMRVGATCEMFVTVLDGEVTRQKEVALGINLWTF